MDEFIPIVANPVNYTESQAIEIATTLIALKKNIERNASYKEIDQINATFADARQHCRVVNTFSVQMSEFVNWKEVVTNDTLMTLANRAKELSDLTNKLSTRLDDVKQILTSRCEASVWAAANNSYLAIGLLSVGLLLHFSVLAPIIIPSAVFLAIGAIGVTIGVGVTFAGAYVAYQGQTKINVDAAQLGNLNELVKNISERFDDIRNNLDKSEIKCCQREDITNLKPLINEMAASSKKLLSDLQAVPRLTKYFRFYNILTIIEYLGRSN